nr:polyketide synthase dehydratase domain-containing protein [Bacillus velezensis]
MIGERGAAARLSLPETADSTADQFVIHPSLLDAAFQASLGPVQILPETLRCCRFPCGRQKYFSRLRKRCGRLSANRAIGQITER